MAVNAAKDSTDLVSKLRAYHNAAQQAMGSTATGPEVEARKKLKWSGLELTEGIVRNNVESGVLEPVISKLKSLKAATEAAIALLRIE